MKRALLIMAKRPTEGRTKTRLCPPLSLKRAAELYDAFLRDIVKMARDAQRETVGMRPSFAYTPADGEGYFRKLASDFDCIYQQGEELSQRLDYVLNQYLHRGYQQVLAINSDSPTLPAAYIAQAYEKLDDPNIDVVFGPCEDGGYYLIGVKGMFGNIVCDVEMSTPNVLRDTLALAKEANLRFALLPTWYDVDTVEELQRLHNELAALPQTMGHHTRKLLSTVLLVPPNAIPEPIISG